MSHLEPRVEGSFKEKCEVDLTRRDSKIFFNF